jgi:hypothetical protein
VSGVAGVADPAGHGHRLVQGPRLAQPPR